VNIGNLLILLAFSGLLISTVSYYLSARGNTRFQSLGYAAYRYFVAFTALASALLMYYFLVGDFSYTYVYDYSSSDLSLFYLISGFWAGQQGTYLLWLLLLAVLGFYLIRRGGEYRDYAMFFYGLIGIFFSVLLLVLSPFEKLPVPQTEGAGLNPLLKDPWMVVHPPVIFVGYAAVALPAVIALAALMKKKFDNWLPIVFGPAALGAVALAAGNIMGGFWAYKTLGWGGYWAWDPVENSSFIPWMTSLAFIHGLLIERRDGALRKTNLFMAILTFLLVIYGTFLTRSGVLADFSVHSFVDLGVNVYLIGFMVGFVLLSLIIYLTRIGKIKGPTINLSLTSQEFVLMVSIWVLLLISALVFSGTSWPLLTSILGNPGTVDTAVYTRVTFPLAMVIGLFLGFSPFLVRMPTPMPQLIKKIIPSLAGAMVVSVIAFVAGVKDISYLLFVFFASVAVFSNLIALSKYFPGRWWHSAAQISHFGFAMMLIGILGSSAYATHEKMVIDRGASDQVYGLDITYRGMAGELTTPDNEIILAVNDGSGEYEVRPKLFWASRMNGLMKKPYIVRHLMYDLYLAPEQIQELEGGQGLKLFKGQAVQMGDYSLKFVSFDQGAHGMSGAMNFGARIEVIDREGRGDTIVPAMEFLSDSDIKHMDAPLWEGQDERPVRLEKIFADEGAILVSIEGLTSASPPDRLILEVSKKPTMNILWAGSIFLALGGLMTVRNRWKMSSTETAGQ